MGLYDMVFWVTGILIVMATYNVILSFKSGQSNHPKLDLLIIAVYYLVTSSLNFIMTVPILNLLILLVYLLVLGRSIGLDIRRNLLGVLLTVGLLAGVEILVGIMTGAVTDSLTVDVYYNNVFGRTAATVFIYMISIGVRKLRNTGNYHTIPVGYWLMLTAMPFMTLFLLMVILSYSAEGSPMVIIGTMIVLVLNVLAFAFYDRLMRLHEKQMDELTVSHLNTGYKRQLEMMKKSVTGARGFQHDLNRHLNTLVGLVDAGKQEEVKAYLDEMRQHVKADESISATGNIVIDSIVNFDYGISGLNKEQVELVYKNVPQTINIQDFDLTVVLSNLLNNAFQAAATVEGGHVKLVLDDRKGVFYIKVINDYNGELKRVDGKYMTTSSDQGYHGYGLLNVEKVIAKYDGVMTTEVSDRVFKTEVVMYRQ